MSNLSHRIKVWWYSLREKKHFSEADYHEDLMLYHERAFKNSLATAQRFKMKRIILDLNRIGPTLRHAMSVTPEPPPEALEDNVLELIKGKGLGNK